MNSEQLLGVVREAVAQGVGSYLWLLVILSICAAGLGAFLGTFLKKKAEIAALNEHFNPLLSG
jgi:hypothetical protein